MGSLEPSGGKEGRGEEREREEDEERKRGREREDIKSINGPQYKGQQYTPIPWREENFL